MAKKLIKVAKQINIGLSTIVEFLGEKGFEVDAKPTAKISDEMYDLLMAKFSTSAEMKEKANSIVMGGNKTESKAKTVVKQTVAPIEVAATPEPEPEPKTPVVEEPVVKLEVVEPTPSTTPAPAPTPEVAPVSEETPPIEIPKEETPKIETPKKEVVEKEVEKEIKEATVVKPTIGLTVKGHVDLDKFNKPKKKTSKPVTKSVEKKGKPVVVSKKTEKPVEKKVVREEKKIYKVSMQQTTTISKDGEKINQGLKAKEEDILRASTPTLKGLKIQGKIDISKLESSSKPKKSTKTDTKGKPGESTARRKRTRTTRRVSPSNYNRGGNRGGQRGAARKGGRAEIKEVSKKEIEDQIKATMARLSGGGKGKRQKLRREIRENKKEKQELQELEREDQSLALKLTEFITVSEFASLMDISATDVIMTCMNLGVFVSINQRLDAEIIELVASEYGHEVEFISAEDTDLEEEEEVDDPKDLIPRAPIVTIMGHVDHGKTSLLDYIRKANVADGEAGGITQHIGSYKVSTEVGGEMREITFLDTPGHEAFTAMRARGAKVTDIAVIIIAADDKIMPQTKEAISHAQAAGVPMIFAINKIDKDGASPERIKQELASANLLIEEWGGKYQSQDISAKQGLNIDLLLEKIVLESDLLELKANPNARAMGTIIEASLDKGRGYTANVLVKNGTLRVGDPMSVGSYYGKVKAMVDQNNVRVKEAGPATPIMVLGLNGAPQAGEILKVYDSEQDAKVIAQKKNQLSREQSLRTTKRISLEEIGRRLALGTFKELNLIIKGDVDGSVEALTDSLEKLSVDTVSVNIIHKAVGSIIESDVLLAAASDAIIIGFQVRPTAGVRNLAEKEEVQIKTYSIIYEAIEDITDAIEGMLEPTKEEKILATVKIQETYKISKVGTIAGCIVEEGKIGRNNFIRVIRDGIVVFPLKEGQIGELSSLKRFKDDAKEVRNGMECGMSIKGFNDIKVDDVIEAYEIIEIEQKLKR